MFDLLLAINILIKVRQVEMAHHTCRDVKDSQVGMLRTGKFVMSVHKSQESNQRR